MGYLPADKRINRNSKKIGWLESRLTESGENLDLNKTKGKYAWSPAFAINKHELNKFQIEFLDGLVALIVEEKITIAQAIDAYADSTGKAEYNLELSQKRANSVAKYLVEKLGADNKVPWDNKVLWKDYFEPNGHGETESYGAKKYNRRVRLLKPIN